MKRLATLLTILSAVGAAAVPAAAPAASYDVTVCRDAAGNVNNAFTATNGNVVRLQATNNCAGTGNDTGGLYAADLLGSGFNTPGGQSAVWRMAAPSGLKITRLRGWTYVFNGVDERWTPFFRTIEGSVLQTCEIVPGDGYCGAGYNNHRGNDPERQDWSMNTDALEFGVSCDSATTCGNGASSIHLALATLFGATITITDNGLPTVTNAGGSLLAGGTLTGTRTATLDAADASGISAVRVYVDGVQRASSTRTCDYTYAKPCSDAPGSSLNVNTAQLSDGSHSVELAAVDAAGQERRSTPQTITVDNTAPVLPAGLAPADAQPQNAAAFTVNWMNPGGQVAPIAAVHWQLCSPGCGPIQTIASAATTLSGTVPSEGTHTVRVWLEDAAGNTTDANAATTTVTYSAPSAGGGGGGGGAGTKPEEKPVDQPATPPVTLPLNPPDPPAVPPVEPPVVQDANARVQSARWNGRTLEVDGKLNRRASGRVVLLVEARAGRRTLRQRTTAAVRTGRWSAHLRLRPRVATADRMTLIVRYRGDGAFGPEEVRQQIRRRA